jgi:hypothetical protein
MLPSTTRLGFHFYPDDRHYSPADLAAWTPILRSFGAAWLVVRASASRSVPEDFLRACWTRNRADHSSSGADRSIDGHRPGASPGSLQLVGRPARPSRPAQRAVELGAIRGVAGIVERFLDRLIPLWNLQADLGLVPFLPPLEPGGDYWDTAFLEGTLRGLARRGQEALLDRIAIGAYAFTYGKPLDWGIGGPAAWPESQPYHTPEGSQDQRGLRLPEWYAAISEASTGRPLPVYVLGGGAIPPRTADEPGSSFEQNAGVARWLLGDDAPPSLKAFAFFLLAANSAAAEAHAAWYATPDRPKGDVDLVQRAAAAAAKLHRPKSISHYILLPPGDVSPELWSLAGQLAHRSASHRATHRASHPAGDPAGDPAEDSARGNPATVGSSPAEAKLATRVTILASPGVVDERVTADLERGGSRVERLDPATLALARKYSETE